MLEKVWDLKYISEIEIQIKIFVIDSDGWQISILTGKINVCRR
jgi:hypothetical protein